MQKFILKKKNLITLVSGILINIAFFCKLVLKNTFYYDLALIIASVIAFLPILFSAIASLKIKVVSIDVLVTLAVVGAFLLKNYEESAIVTFLFLFGAFLEQRTLNKTRRAIKELTEMAPEVALKLMNSNEFREVAIEEVEVGDILLVKTGAKVPVDGIVLIGEAHINEASITGESLPISKNIGSYVYCGTIVENGTIQIKAEKVGVDTTFGKIIELVEEAQDSKSIVERFIDRFAKYYTPVVLLLAILIGLIMWDIPIAITILVLGCPGALVIGVPVSHVAGIGNGARNGVLFKGSEVINDLSKVDVIAFDKTGTLTQGKPLVVDLKYYKQDTELINYLVSVEKESDHPLAKAIVAYFKETKTYQVENTKVFKGGGIIATVNKHQLAIGNLSLLNQENIIIEANISSDIKNLENKGSSIVLVALDGKLQMLIGIRDQIRDNVKEDLKELKKLGIKNLIVLSGDNQKTVDIIASELALTKAYGNMLPEDKANYISSLKKEQKIVAFVGDGVNDSPSLALAHIVIAMGGGTYVAIQTSDVVLMNSDFDRLPHAIGLAKAIVKNMQQNIIIALGVVILLLVSIFLNHFFHFSERMMSIGMLVHEASILVVILNGMRLLRYKFKKIKRKE